MRLPLELESDDGALTTFRARVPGNARVSRLRYATRTGALLRVDGAVCGAFDREHRTIDLAEPAYGALALDVEQRALPTRGLPPTGGLRWRMVLARAAQRPARFLTAGGRSRKVVPERAPSGSFPCAGHSHLDVAWLWTYEEAARKALRTFATAVRQLEREPAFVFSQSQPQLYAWIAERDPVFYERIRALARAERIDTSGAAMWVEADCNLPSGESLLRQLVAGMRFVERETGTLPSVAWLPDSFGFPNTLPTLLAHAGVTAFATTKLGWNDTTEFPHARFVWEGPDGSRVAAAQIASIDGGFERRRVRRARARGDLLLIGYGDGGGGARDDTLARAPTNARWTTLDGWFAGWASQARTLPVVRDELYLQEHRGTATTHHDVKARHAALERALAGAERSLAWAAVLRASPFFLAEARGQLARAWEIVLRAEFHDVLPGSAIAEVYADVRDEFDAADALVAHVAAGARSVLPQAQASVRAVLPPHETRDGFALANDVLEARIAYDGTLRELRIKDGDNLVRRAGRLALYVDRPKRWDAWNVDRSYGKRERRVRVTGCELVDGELEIRYAFGRSLAVSRISLRAGEPFLRVDVAVDWHERHALLRYENDLAFAAERARFGSPYGAVDRAPAPHTKAERAKFEAAGQRFARVETSAGGLALFALDTYGWSVGARRGRTALGHSLLRGPTWPDPAADEGVHEFSLAFAPFASLGMGALERLWERFAGGGGDVDVPLFVPDDSAVTVVATKPADDGDGIVFRARECDGRDVHATISVGARPRDVSCCDALERPARGVATLEDGAIHAAFRPFELRSFRVRVA